MLAIVGAAGTSSTVPIRGKVTFTPMIKSGDALVLTTLSPRPGLVSPAPVTGVIGSDGQLGFGGSGVRLIADTSVLGLSSPLFYTVDFVGLTVNGQSRQLTSFNFQASQSDTPINLVTVARVPGQPASGIVNTRSPDHVRLNGSNQVVFSANGVDLPDPLPIEGFDADLADIAALAPSNDDVVQRKAGHWTNRTPAQLKTDMALGNVDNVSEATVLSAAASASKSADTIVDGTTNKVLSATDKTRLAGTSGTNTGDQTSVSGNAGTATKLATARNINGVAFDGTANITVADSTKLATSAVVDNADGTIAVGSVTGMETLPVAASVVTANTAPAIGKTTYYNAKTPAANLAPPFPALSGLAVGARFAVRRDPTDDSAYTITLTCAGGDTFYLSGGTTATLPVTGEQREYQVIQPGGSGSKYWAPVGPLNPLPGLDARFGALGTADFQAGNPVARSSYLPTFTKSANNPFLTIANQTLTSMVWPAAVYVGDIFNGPGPYGEYWRCYYSTDHALTANTTKTGIALATCASRTPEDGATWVDRGRVFIDTTDGGPDQTETPCVIYVPDAPSGAAFYMYYHRINAADGEIVRLATMTVTQALTAESWTIHPVNSGTCFMPPHDGISNWPPALWGYARPFRIGGDWWCHLLISGNPMAAFGIAHSDTGLPGTWTVDARPILYDAHHMRDPAGRFNAASHYLAWNSGTVFKWKSQMWWCGLIFGRTGGGGKPCYTYYCVAPISNDFRRLLGTPTVVFTSRQSWEANITGAPAGMGDNRGAGTLVAGPDGRMRLFYQGIGATDLLDGTTKASAGGFGIAMVS